MWLWSVLARGLHGVRARCAGCNAICRGRGFRARVINECDVSTRIATDNLLKAMTKYDPAQAQRLDAAERATWNNPREFVASVEITPGSRVAEIGCGTGWFTFELEKATRPRGMVYALDMQPAMLQI